jgi:hypothetical protein
LSTRRRARWTGRQGGSRAQFEEQRAALIAGEPVGPIRDGSGELVQVKVPYLPRQRLRFGAAVCAPAAAVLTPSDHEVCDVAVVEPSEPVQDVQ